MAQSVVRSYKAGLAAETDFQYVTQSDGFVVYLKPMIVGDVPVYSLIKRALMAFS